MAGSPKQDAPKPFKVLKGIDYPDNKRAEPGQVVTDLPGYAVGWLQEQGAIEPYEED